MALQRVLLAQALLALAHVARCNFVTSLHSNYVVNLDFESDNLRPEAEASAADADEGDMKVMAFAGGSRKFRCKLPSSRNRTRDTSRSEELAQSKAHFIAAKLATLRGSCWTYKQDFWSYDVCFGRKITQYRPDGDTRFSLGEHVADADELLPTGGVRELYMGGADNRTTELRYVCGSSEASSRTFKLSEERPLYYVIEISGPTFCLWREEDGNQARDASGRPLPASALLEELRGSCVNVTQGWWTYEYCYPRQLTQFHMNGNGKKRDPEHALGTMSGSTAPTEANAVEMTIVRLKPSISPRERRAPPSNHRTLRQRMGGGTVCDQTNRPRATSMHFQCPLNWQSRPETRIISISEGSLCEYDVMIHTTLLCGHEKFLPTMPKGKETIQCVAEPERA
mmetsp:Transcript_9259/g.23830  ORF Transcript_9259/g.23830 Transcript_9259/m.23830 type:complete len:397 (+) Transcript_9259:67-1257(+)